MKKKNPKQHQFILNVCYVWLFCMFRAVLSVCFSTSYFITVPWNFALSTLFATFCLWTSIQLILYIPWPTCPRCWICFLTYLDLPVPGVGPSVPVLYIPWPTCPRCWTCCPSIIHTLTYLSQVLDLPVPVLYIPWPTCPRCWTCCPSWSSCGSTTVSWTRTRSSSASSSSSLSTSRRVRSGNVITCGAVCWQFRCVQQG